MGLEYKIDVDAHVVRVTVTRDTSVGEIRNAVKAVIADPLFGSDMSILADFRELRWIPSTQELKQVAELVGAVAKHVKRRTAMVVSNDLVFGAVRIFSLLAKAKGFQTRPFKDMDKACEWLELQP